MQGYEVLNRIEYFEDKVEKLEKKLEIATDALEYCRGSVECANDALMQIEEIDNEQ